MVYVHPRSISSNKSRDANPRLSDNGNKLKRKQSKKNRNSSEDLVEVEDVKSERKNCKYLRGNNSSTTQLPKDIQLCVPSVSDPLVAPLSEITDDYHNFGGGVNPLGRKGHTFTENGYGPVYVNRNESWSTREKKRPSVRPSSSQSFDILIEKIASLEHEQQKKEHKKKTNKKGNKNRKSNIATTGTDIPSHVRPPQPVYKEKKNIQNDTHNANHSSCSSYLDVTRSYSKQNLPQSPDIEQQQRQLDSPESSLVGPLSPFSANVSLYDLGGSKVLGDNWYLTWRILHLILCFASSMIAILKASNASGIASCVAITYSTFTSIFSLRRSVQFRLVRAHGGSHDNVHDARYYSWFDVLARQLTPVMCLAVGLSSTGIFSVILSMRGIIVTHYKTVEFYFTLLVSFVTFLDVWIGMIPTRGTYTTPIFVICGLVIIYPSIGFEFSLIGVIIGLVSLISFVLSLLLHFVARLIWLNYHRQEEENVLPTSMTAFDISSDEDHQHNSEIANGV